MKNDNLNNEEVEETLYEEEIPEDLGLDSEEIPQNEYSENYADEEYNDENNAKGNDDKKYSAKKKENANNQEEINQANLNSGEVKNKFKNKNSENNFPKNMANKINEIQDKAYNVTHPGQMIKEKTNDVLNNAKDTAKEKVNTALKNGTKAVGEASKKALLAGGKALMAFFSTPPGMIVLGMIVVGILLLFIMLMFFGGNGNSNNYVGLFGYEYYEACTEVEKDGHKMSMEDYVAHVLSAEVGGFPIETQKAIAIGARTYVIMNGTEITDGDSCYYNADNVDQSYKEDVTDLNIQAATETRGLIITINDKPRSHYDASCVFTAEDAALKDPNGNYSDDNYYIRYGKWDLKDFYSQEDFYLFQPVDKNKIHMGFNGESLEDYADKAETIGACSGNHGGGMSQNGAAYLELYDGYTWEDIINYYYEGNAVIKSIYKSYQVTNNWTQVISLGNYSAPLTILNTPLYDLLSQTEIEELNELMHDAVVSAGIGTRDALVVAGTLPIQYLAENYNVLIPYTWGGGRGNAFYDVHTGLNVEHVTSNYYGVDPYWGSKIDHSAIGNLYEHYGPDCGAWVAFAFHNAGISYAALQTDDLLNVFDSDSIHPADGSYIGAPGDILLHKHEHIMLIVGVDEDNGIYYISQAQGNEYGVNVVTAKIDQDDSSFVVIDVSKYIEENVISTYDTDFENGVIQY